MNGYRISGKYQQQKPTVKVTAKDPQASEPGKNKGTFLFARTGNTSKALTVRYSVGGTAKRGIDYLTLSGKVVIPQGKASAKVLVTPVDDREIEGRETVVVTLKPVSTYIVGSPSTAEVYIDDND